MTRRNPRISHRFGEAGQAHAPACVGASSDCGLDILFPDAGGAKLRTRRTSRRSRREVSRRCRSESTSSARVTAASVGSRRSVERIKNIPTFSISFRLRPAAAGHRELLAAKPACRRRGNRGRPSKRHKTPLLTAGPHADAVGPPAG